MRTADPSRTAPTPAARRRVRPPNRALRALLEETEWTQAAFARALSRLGAEIGIQLRYDRTSVAHWLRGSRPDPRVQHLIAEALSRRLGRPVAVADLGMADGRATPSTLSTPGDGRRADTTEGAGPGDGAHRRTPDRDPASPGTRAPAHPADRLTALTAPVVPPPRADSPPPAPYTLGLLEQTVRPARGARGEDGRTGAERAAVPAPVRPPAARTPGLHRTVPGTGPGGPGAVASVHEHARFFALQADRYGGGHIRTSLAAYLSGLVRTLRTGPGDAHHRGLLAGAARLSFLLARVYADERRHGLAQRAFVTAAELAAEAEDPEGVALARRALGSQAHQLGHPRASHTLARAALAAAPAAVEPSVRAYLYAGLAVARAACGERSGALEALRDAEHQLARAPLDLTTGPGAPGAEPVGTYQDAALLYQSGQVRAALGDRPGAVRELRASLHARPATELRPRAITRAELAELLLAEGRLEEACAAWQGFLQDADRVRSGRVQAARARLPVLLRPYAREGCVRSLLAHTNSPAGVRSRG